MIHPNPFSEATTISFELNIPVSIRIIIYDQLGSVVREFPRQDYPSGAHSVTCSSEGLLPGLYLVRLQAGKEHAVEKLVVK
jgi:hypothetical protein